MKFFFKFGCFTVCCLGLMSNISRARDAGDVNGILNNPPVNSSLTPEDQAKLAEAWATRTAAFARSNEVALQGTAAILNAQGSRAGSILNGSAARLNAIGNAVGSNGTAIAGINNSRANMILAQGDFMRAKGEFSFMISQARLNYARVSYLRAKTQRVEQEVRFWSELIFQLSLQLKQMRKDESKFQKQIIKLERVTKRIRWVKATGKFGSSQFRAYQTLMAINKSSSIGDVGMETPINDEISEENFVSNSLRSRPEVFYGSNLGQLLKFMASRDLSFSFSYPAHLLFNSSIDSLVMASAQDVEDLSREILSLRDANLDVWQRLATNIRSSEGNGFGSGF